MKLRVSGVEVAVGAFVLLGALGFLLLYMASGGHAGLGREWVRLRGRFGGVSGVAVGTEVRMNGIEIGLVERAGLDPAGRVEVVMLIDRRHAAFVRQSDAARRLAQDGREPTPAEVAALRAEGSSTVSVESSLLTTGGGQLVVTQGAASLPPATAGEALVGLPQSSFLTTLSAVAETLGDIAGRGRERPGGSLAAFLQDEGRLYEQTTGALARAGGTIDNLDATVTGLGEDLRAGAEELNAILRETRQVLETMNRRGVLGAMGGPDSRLQPQLEAILASLQEVMEHLRTLSAQLPELGGATGELVGRGHETLGSVDDLLGASKRHWLLRDLFDPARDEWLRAHDLGPRPR